LAEGVEFPEKNAGSGVLKSSFGGGDPPVGSATRLVAILNHAGLRIQSRKGWEFESPLAQ
jgi:hypothetical protein